MSTSVIKALQMREYARTMRKNMTEEEFRLWYKFLKGHTLTFKRQKIIDDYIVDFYCPQKKLIIEVDGWQHYEEEGEKKDAVRDEVLKSKGYTVLRYTNRDIRLKFKEVCWDIEKHLQ